MSEGFNIVPHDPTKSKKAPTRFGIKRNGSTVYIMPEGAAKGLAVNHRNAQSARATESGLRERLTAGWPGTLEELLRAVGEATAAQEAEYAAKARAKREQIDRLRADRSEHETHIRRIDAELRALLGVDVHGRQVG